MAAKLAAPPKGSPPLSIAGTDLKKLLIGAGVAAGGAALTYAAEWVATTDFGNLTPVVTALAAVLVNAARKFLFDTNPV